MSADQDPPRWVEPGSDAPEQLRALLEAARADLPDEAELASVAAALGPLLGGPAAPPAAPPSHPHVPGPGAGALGGAAAKIAGVIALAGAVGGGLWLASHHGAAPAARVPLSSAAPARPAPEAVAEPGPSAVVEPAPATVAEPPPSAAQAQAPVPARAPATAPDEAQLLRAAQAALKTDPARALALTQEHKRRFPHGVLAQEREVIAIEALSKVDQAAAKKRAEQFRQEYPGSAHESKVGAAVQGQ